MDRMDITPVFLSEWRRVSRQWRFYAFRSALVGGLLVGLGVAWLAASRLDEPPATVMARAGLCFFAVVALGQLAMVLLAAPAATASAFSTQMARGHVCLMLLTGLTSAEIVLGTLCARLVPLLATVACVVPVLGLASSLGGGPPHAMVRLEILTAGCAVVGCTLALVLSIGARRLHEALLASYVLLSGWVLGSPILFMIQTTSAGRIIPGWWVRWARDVNPCWLALKPILSPGSEGWDEIAMFLGGTLALSAALAGLAFWRLRPVALTGPERARRLSWIRHPPMRRSLISVDSHPLLWLECRWQPQSRWFRLLWSLYVAGAVMFTALVVVECAAGGARRAPWAGPFNGFQAAVGLMMLSLLAPAALAEERARGCLEVLLSTPLSSRGLVLSKWLATYRAVPCLALLPAVVAVAQAGPSGRWLGVPLVSGMVLAHGAAVTSLGIALATWVSRIDRALILSAAVSVLVTVAWIPLMMLLFRGDEVGVGLAMGSPLLGVGLLTSEMLNARPAVWPIREGWALFWIVADTGIAAGLLGATLASFDRCLGRMSPRAATRSGRRTTSRITRPALGS